AREPDAAEAEGARAQREEHGEHHEQRVIESVRHRPRIHETPTRPRPGRPSGPWPRGGSGFRIGASPPARAFRYHAGMTARKRAGARRPRATPAPPPRPPPPPPPPPLALPPRPAPPAAARPVAPPGPRGPRT